ncbi:hypothetical protein L207DRAFT_326934 [Hyaloscypha variabilis F]|uniref:Uncharacterized protein n=1 Tax=Hyaloscypha variabilis (strain UAMH 11265 / GT02V1 / F) TaxID=1149755 RepID=A0A2J6RSK7_HYAVF|nr:hypothetical protein L207DRAFT_326934 [Hyaloscypha variabilis F]
MRLRHSSQHRHSKAHWSQPVKGHCRRLETRVRIRWFCVFQNTLGSTIYLIICWGDESWVRKMLKRDVR